MRTLFLFPGNYAKDSRNSKFDKIQQLKIFKDDIPYRFQEGDMVLVKVFSTDEFLEIIKSSGIVEADHPLVDCTSFDRDSKGVYQNVWITLDGWE